MKTITTTELQIETLLPWGEPKKIGTKAGERILRKAEPTETFWALWRQNKEALRAAGLSVGQYQGAWEVCWWQPLDPVEAQKQKEARETDRREKEAALAGELATLTSEQEVRLQQIVSKLIPYQIPSVRRQVNALTRYGGALDASDTGCHAKGTKILMHDGTIKLVESIKVGDRLMGWDGTAREVLSLARGREKMVRIVPVKGESFEVNMSHILTLVQSNSHSSRTASKTNGRIVDVKVSEWLKWNREQKHLHKLFRMPVTCWGMCNFELAPYSLGILLGDGCMTTKNALSLSKPGRVMLAAAQEIATRFGCSITTDKDEPTHHFRGGSLWSELESLGIAFCDSGSKRIPPTYKTACMRDRLQLLAGLMDTDGSLTSGGYDYISKSKTLAEDVVFVARSVGLAAYVKPCQKFCQTGGGGAYYRVSISGDCAMIPCRQDNRKAGERKQKKDALRTGFEVVELPESEFYGFSITGDGRFLLGDFTVTHNTGKTYVNLATCYILNQKPFIICPKAVIPSWKRAAQHFGIKLAGVLNHERVREGSDGITQVTFEYVKVRKGIQMVDKRELKSMDWLLPKDTILIFDECHRQKDYKTLNCQLGLRALAQGYKVLGLSATAADNPMQMKFSGLLTQLFRNEKSFWPWMMRNGVRKQRFGYEFSGDKAILDRIHQEIFPIHGTRIKIKDLGDQFPETQITAEAYEVNGATEEINRIYAEMDAQLSRLSEKEKEDKECVLTIRLRARQRTEILKVPAIVELVENAVEEGLSVAVFVNFDDSADSLMAKLKTKCCIRGSQQGPKGEVERQRCIDDFNADKEHVIVCNIKAGGVGVSLHGTPTSRMRMSIICVTDSAQDAKQALGRVWRAKGAKSIQKFFFAAGTIEESDIMPNMRSKIDRIDTLNDGDLRFRAERPMPLSDDDIPMEYVKSI